jgi:hypothetical protein
MRESSWRSRAALQQWLGVAWVVLRCWSEVATVPNWSEFSLRQINTRCAGMSAAVHQSSQTLELLMHLQLRPTRVAHCILFRKEKRP